jgi:DNA-binding beta-propeller fold protein YncE
VSKLTGLIYTIAGNGVSGFSGDGGPALAAEITFPTGIAVDSSGKVYFADESNNRIRVLTPVAPRPHRFSQRLRP